MDASHEKFRGLFMRTLKEQLKAAGRKLDYVLVSHTEPDHSGAFTAALAAKIEDFSLILELLGDFLYSSCIHSG